MEIPTLEYLMSIKPGKLSGNFIKKEFPDFYDFLIKKYSEFNLSFSEKLYWYYNNITNYPKCECCDNLVTYKSFNVGYHKFCSTRCSTLSTSTQQKIKNTCLKKYGVEHSSKLKQTIQKMKQTNMDKYGCECSLQNEEISIKRKNTWIQKYGVEYPVASNEIKEKIKQTNLQKYGVESTLQTEQVKEKTKQTNLKKYGVEHYTNKEKAKQTNLLRYGCENIFGSQEKQKQSRDTKIKKFIKKHNDYLIDIINKNGCVEYVCKCPHENCNGCDQKQFIINSQHYTVRRYNNVELCTILNPVSKDKIEGTSIELFVRNILDSNHINYINNDRKQLKGKELDIYIPDKQIAIECNGIYWHSNEYRKKEDHVNKWDECRKNNIQLLTIWEDQIIKKPNIIESIILSKLGIYKKRIYARNCTIKQVSNKESFLFLNDNHLQGNVGGSVKLGLYYNNELVSIMVFGKNRKIFNSSSDGWELYRFCNKIGYQIIGGASKLFNYFIINYNPSIIVSFSSNDISNGHIYKILGFSENTKLSQSYWYIDDKMNRYHRYKFRKSELIKNGFDKNLSESKIMSNLKYFKIYDCGQTKYIWNK